LNKKIIKTTLKYINVPTQVHYMGKACVSTTLHGVCVAVVAGPVTMTSKQVIHYTTDREKKQQTKMFALKKIIHNRK
jgi:hypothetical protein